jgi:hypothetical protein
MTPNPGSVVNCGSVGWQVRVPFRDSAGKASTHYKTVLGSKKAAQSYLDWYSGLVAAGDAPETVSQAALQELAALDRKAAKFRENLLLRLAAGGRVEPGTLILLGQTEKPID